MRDQGRWIADCSSLYSAATKVMACFFRREYIILSILIEMILLRYCDTILFTPAVSFWVTALRSSNSAYTHMAVSTAAADFATGASSLFT